MPHLQQDRQVARRGWTSGVLSATGVLSDNDMDRQVTQRQFAQQNGSHTGRFPFHKYDAANENNHHIMGGLADALSLDSEKQYTLQTVLKK